MGPSTVCLTSSAGPGDESAHSRQALVWSVTHVTGLRVGERTQQSNHRGRCSAFTLKIGIPVVRTSSFHCKGHEFDPWSGDRSQSPHGVLHGQKKTNQTILESGHSKESGISLDGIWAVLKSGRWRQEPNGIEARRGFSPDYFTPDQAASLVL